MSLRTSYTLLAPFYDFAIRPAFDKVRRSCLREFPGGGRVLVDGIGTSLDLPFLPPDNRYVGLDLTAAMLRHVATRTDVVFEQVLALRVVADQPLLGSGWFRCIRLEKCA